jgi:hypothetical protein
MRQSYFLILASVIAGIGASTLPGATLPTESASFGSCHALCVRDADAKCERPDSCTQPDVRARRTSSLVDGTGAGYHAEPKVLAEVVPMAKETESGRERNVLSGETDPSSSPAPNDAAKKASEQVGPWEWVNKVFAILVPSGILALALQVFLNWRKDRDEQRRKTIGEVREFCDVLRQSLTREQRNHADKYRSSFYAGSSDDLHICVALDLDAERTIHRKVMETIEAKQPDDWFHVPIYGDWKQGKSIVLARLARNLSRARPHRLLGRKYRILWCRTAMNSFRQSLRKGEDLSTYISTLSQYAKCLARRGRIIVLIDDFYRPEQLPSDDTLGLESRASFLRRLNEEGLSIITCSSTADARIHESEAAFKLTLDEGDVQSILSKLKQQQLIEQESVDAFSRNRDTRSLFRRQLFAFLSLLCSEGDRKDGFIKDFKKQFGQLSETERRALHAIALCQLVDVRIPEGILLSAFPEADCTPSLVPF